MKNILNALVIRVCVSILLFSSPQIVLAEELPEKLQAALILKILGLEKKIGVSSDIKIYVLDSATISDLLSKEVGRKVGKGTIAKVDSGTEIPSDKYDVIYIGNPFKEGDALAYSTKNKAMSIYSVSDKSTKKGTLGIGVKSGKPTFLLNLSTSSEEGLDWNPAILKVAATQ